MLIGGLDIGTTGCKLSVYDDKGVFVSNSYREYSVDRRGGEHEIDAEAIFAAVCEVLAETLASHCPDAIGVTSFGETFAAVDSNGNVLLPSMLYTDPRGHAECAALCEKMGEVRLTEIAGVRPNAMYSLPKLMWIKRNRPDIYQKIARVLLIEDYIIYKLCGNACIDYALAARTMAFDIRKKQWSEEILAAAEIDPALFSTPVATGNVAGELLPSLCTRFGLQKPIRIVNGSHDQVAATVGAGILSPNEAMDGTGTVECIVPVFDHIPQNGELYQEGYSVVPFVFDGTYVCYALSFTGGATLKWFRDSFFAHRADDKDFYRDLDASIPQDPTGILVLPHFAGAANPYMDNSSRAAIVGLTLEHDAKDLYKALMEGVTYEIMTNIEHLESFGISPRRLFATGGGAKSKVWLQIKADILGRPITVLEAEEVGACGTCMLTGVGIGLYRDLFEAKRVFVKEKKTYTPDPQKHLCYQKYYQAYRQIYGAVRPIIKEEDHA